MLWVFVVEFLTISKKIIFLTGRKYENNIIVKIDEDIYNELIEKKNNGEDVSNILPG